MLNANQYGILILIVDISRVIVEHTFHFSSTSSRKFNHGYTKRKLTCRQVNLLYIIDSARITIQSDSFNQVFKMWFPLVKRDHCALSILCLMVSWCDCAGTLVDVDYV